MRRYLHVTDMRAHSARKVADWAKVIIAQPESALHRAANPEWRWGLAEFLSAEAVDTLRLLLWAKTKDAEKGANRPRPLPRPGVAVPQGERVGEAMDVDELDAFLARERE